MSDLNQCSFIGRLGADPEIKSFQSGGRIANLRLAIGEQWKDKSSGERKERTEWISVTVNSDGLIGVVERFLRKGSKLFVQGQMRTRKWQDQSGNDRYSTEIIVGSFGGIIQMLDGKPDGERTPDGSRGAPAATDWQDDLSDEIPFVSRNSIW